jgi:hypothetical protein
VGKTVCPHYSIDGTSPCGCSLQSKFQVCSLGSSLPSRATVCPLAGPGLLRTLVAMHAWLLVASVSATQPVAAAHTADLCVSRLQHLVGSFPCLVLLALQLVCFTLEVSCLIALCNSDRQQLCWLPDECLSAGNAGRQYGLLGFVIMSSYQVCCICMQQGQPVLCIFLMPNGYLRRLLVPKIITVSPYCRHAGTCCWFPCSSRAEAVFLSGSLL